MPNKKRADEIIGCIAHLMDATKEANFVKQKEVVSYQCLLSSKNPETDRLIATCDNISDITLAVINMRRAIYYLDRAANNLLPKPEVQPCLCCERPSLKEVCEDCMKIFSEHGYTVGNAADLNVLYAAHISNTDPAMMQEIEKLKTSNQ